MAGRIILGILLGLLLILAILLAMTAEIRGRYDQGEASLWVRYGPLKLQLYPPKKPQKEKKQKEPPKEKELEEDGEAAPKKRLSVNREQILYTLETLPPILSRALGRARRSVRLGPMKIHLLIAGEDPAGTALFYGRAQAALAAGLPALRRTVRIREEDVRLFLDFQRTRPDCIADVGVSIRCWDAARIAVCAGGSLGKWFFGLRRLASPSEEKRTEEEKRDSGAA